MIKDDRTISEDSWLFTDYITVLWSKNLIFFISRISQDCGWKARQRPEILLNKIFYDLEAIFISKFYISVGSSYMKCWNNPNNETFLLKHLWGCFILYKITGSMLLILLSYFRDRDCRRHFSKELFLITYFFSLVHVVTGPCFTLIKPSRNVIINAKYIFIFALYKNIC